MSAPAPSSSSPTAASGLQADGFWFMEMNTRLQVEHPVTEAITGLDLVEWQLRVAAGEKLPLTQEQVPLGGHAIEARLYAEDPEHGFLPSTGKLVGAAICPTDVRVDSGVEAGDEVTPFYDPMIAKVIAHAPTRDAALDRLTDALDHTLVAGVRTNVAFLGRAVPGAGVSATARSTPASSTAISPRLAPCRKARTAPPRRPACERLLAQEQARRVRSGRGEPASPWDASDGFQLGGTRRVIVADRRRRRGRRWRTVVRRDGMASRSEAAPAPDAARCLGRCESYVLRHGRQTRVRLERSGSIGAAEQAAATALSGRRCTARCWAFR